MKLNAVAAGEMCEYCLLTSPEAFCLVFNFYYKSLQIFEEVFRQCYVGLKGCIS